MRGFASLESRRPCLLRSRVGSCKRNSATPCPDPAFDVQGAKGRGQREVARTKLAAAHCESLEPGARLEFHDVGWSGWTRPPTMRGGVSASGSRRVEAG